MRADDALADVQAEPFARDAARRRRAVSAPEELRHLGFEGSITLIDPDEQAPYDRPNLSKEYLAGTAPEEWMPLHPRSYYQELGLELLLGRRVTALAPGTKSLVLDDGTTRQFGAIVLATGAEPVRLVISDTAGPHVHYLRTLDAWQRNMHEHRNQLEAVVGPEDVRRFDTYLRLSKHALRSGTMTVEATVFEKRR